MATTTKDRKTAEELEAKASLPVNHPKAGYVSPDLSAIDGREPPNEEDTPHRGRLTREERIEKRDEEVEAVAEAEDKSAKEWREAEEEADRLADEARKKQVAIQAKAGLVPEPTPTAAELASKQSSSKESSK